MTVISQSNANFPALRRFAGWMLLVLPIGFYCFSLLSAALRASSGMSFQNSLLFAGAIIFSIVTSYRKDLNDYLASVGLRYYALLALISSYAFSQLYYEPYAGLVSVGGGDAGNHVNFKKRFLATDPGIYHGFVGFFANDAILAKIFGLNDFESFRLSYYFGLYVLLLLVCLLVAKLNKNLSSKPTNISLVLLLILGFFPTTRIFLPSVHYLQADGFYPQFFGLLPLFLLWLALAITDTTIRSFVVSAVFLVFYRFTYGLNLGDLLLALAFFYLVQATRHHNTSKFKYLLLLCSLVLLVTGCLFFFKLSSVSSMPGAINAAELNYTVIGLFVISLALLVEGNRHLALSNTYQPIFFFPALFGLFNASVLTVQLLKNHEPTYYLYKYSFHSVALLTAAAVIVSISVIVNCASRRWTHTAVVLTLFLVGLWQFKAGYQTYRPSFVERASKALAPKLIEPLAESQVWVKISDVLEQNSAKFGGYITPSWPISNFTNAAFGHYGERPLFESGLLTLDKGYCVFFQSSEVDQKKYRKYPALAKKVSSLLASSDVISEKYYSVEHRSEKQLSWICNLAR